MLELIATFLLQARNTEKHTLAYISSIPVLLYPHDGPEGPYRKWIREA